ncbi:YggT family protein [Synechococcus sp. Nb3U1]|uniref:YggT family protein n=1 Tax=Synechococcus sp. Nb3U1 TaxID=1914529 RepID=UPI001F287CC1|nr:YggT family protein [Synechococcus sp. Nb3U1]MCF2972100.1 YggT family protein [Synechococcus sp. Nb3U1]
MMLSHLLSPLISMDSLSFGLVYTTAGSLLFRSIYQFIVIYNVLLIVRILLSWFPQLNWSNPILSVLSQLTDPYLNLFRGIIPPIGGLDFSPWLAFILLSFAMQVVGQFA